MRDNVSSDGLHILGLVDLHWSGQSPLRLPELRDYDLVVLGGDITNFRGIEEARRVIDEIKSQGPDVLAVCGNCDQPEVEEYLEAEDIALDRSARVVRGMRFAGLSGGLPFGGCPYERTERELEEAWGEASKALHGLGESSQQLPLLFVTHQPPIDTCCDLTRGRHVGSRAVRAAIEEHQPDLVLCGHIHEGIGLDTIGRTRVANPGPWFAGHSAHIELRSGRLQVELR